MPKKLDPTRVWTTSENTPLKSENKASSNTLMQLPSSTELFVLTVEGRWFKVQTESGERGWIYCGHVSDIPPQESKTKNCVTSKTTIKNTIGVTEDDTIRSIRG